MNVKSITIAYYLLFIAVLFSSCCIQKKIRHTEISLGKIRNQQAAEEKQLFKIDTIAKQKLAEGKIDNNIYSRIQKKIRTKQELLAQNKAIANRVDSLLVIDKHVLRNFKKIIWPLLDSLQKDGDAYASRLNVYLMTEYGLKISDYYLFDLAVFFGPGKYLIPKDKEDITLHSFAPIFDSVVSFSNRFKDIPKTVTLIILGFADGNGFMEGDPFTDSLKLMINNPDASKKELNKKLSELRARELIKHLTKLFLVKKAKMANLEKIKFEYIGEGKGEEYPLPTIRNYTVDDPRRRIVLCYWSILPDE